jgi:hypothetical protein
VSAALRSWPADPVLGPGQPAGIGEGGAELAGPVPGLDGGRLVQQVEVGLDRGQVGGQPKHPARQLPGQPGDAGIPRHAECRCRGRELGRLRPGTLGVAEQQRQPRGKELVLECQAPAEHQVAGQQLPSRGEPGCCAVRVAGVKAQLSEVLQGGDGQFFPALRAAERE